MQNTYGYDRIASVDDWQLVGIVPNDKTKIKKISKESIDEVLKILPESVQNNKPKILLAKDKEGSTRQGEVKQTFRKEMSGLLNIGDRINVKDKIILHQKNQKNHNTLHH